MSKLFKNYLYNLSYQIILMLIPVITTPYISRILGTNGVGLYNYSYAICSVALMFAQLGINTYGQREIAFVQSDCQCYSQKFWEIFLIRVLATFSVFPVYIRISCILTEARMLMLGMSLYLFANIFDVSWFFQGIEDFKKVVIRSSCVKVVGTILIFIFVKTQADIFLYAMILSGTQLAGNICLFLFVLKYVYAPRRCSIHIKEHMKPVFALFLPTAAMYIYTYIDKIILRMFSNNYEVGIYSQPEKIVKLLMTVLTSFGTVLLPHVAAEINSTGLEMIRTKLKKSIRFIVCLGLPLMIGSIIVSKRFILWFLGKEFYESVLLFQILSPLIMIIGLASVTGQAILIPLKLEKVYTLSILCGAGSNLLFNLMTVPAYGAIGAAAATLFAEFTVTAIQFWTVRRTVQLSIRECLYDCRNYIAGTVSFGVILYFLDGILPQENFFMLFIITGTGVIFYFIYLILVKDAVGVYIVRCIKGRKR